MSADDSIEHVHFKDLFPKFCGIVFSKLEPPFFCVEPEGCSTVSPWECNSLNLRAATVEQSLLLCPRGRLQGLV